MTLWITIIGMEVWRRDYHELKKVWTKSRERINGNYNGYTKKIIQVIVELRAVFWKKKNLLYE